MAISYQKRQRGGTVRITATVRRDGVSISATFGSEKVAKVWAHQCEVAVERSAELGIPFDRQSWVRRGRDRTVKEIIGDAVDGAEKLAFEREPDTDPKPRVDWTLKRALRHYVETVTPTKKGSKAETDRIKAWMRRPIANSALEDVSPGHIQQHVNSRRAEGKAATTIRNEVFLLSAVYAHAAKLPPPPPNEVASSTWGLVGLANPVHTVELPDPPPHRDRRLQDGENPEDPGEEERMISALRAGPDGELMAGLFVFAVETGMRLGEILAIVPGNLVKKDGARCVAVPDSKNGRPRDVVLSTRAWATIQGLIPEARAAGRSLFPLGTHAVEYRWRKARRAGEIVGLKFHDLRHEGLSRMANRGLTMSELQDQGGQRTPSVLLRYLNKRPSEVARKLG